MEERTAAIRGIAGFTEVGMKADPKETLRLRDLGVIKTADDFGIDMSRANRSMLAAKTYMTWSFGLKVCIIRLLNSETGKRRRLTWHYRFWNLNLNLLQHRKSLRNGRILV